MRHFRLALVLVAAALMVLVSPTDVGEGSPGLGGAVVFSVSTSGLAHDISPGAVFPGVTCTSADILTAPGGPAGPCAARVPPAPLGPVPWGVTGPGADLGLNTFGVFSDDLDSLSFGEINNLATMDFDFSVDPAPVNGGVTTGAPVTPPCAPFVPNVTSEAALAEAQGDIFTSGGAVPAGCNMQDPALGDEATRGLIAPSLAPPPLDNVDALAEFTFAGGPCFVVAGTTPTACAAYTLAMASASLPAIAPDVLTLAPVTGATILAQPGTIPAPPGLPAGCPLGGLPCAAVGFPVLGLVAMDDIDALCWYDVLPNGAPDLPTGALGPGFLGDIYVFSLTPASPSAGLFGGPAALSRAGGAPVITPAVLPPGFFGLLPTDNIDGLICHDDDSDFDAVPDWLDNCDITPNVGQQDTDGDGIGDACDTEGPSPNTNGVGGADDCFDGVDNNANGFTDAADPGCGDTDGDGIPDALDNCPTVPNPGQANVDLDAFGDVCDTEGPSPNTSGLGGADDCYDGVDNDGDGLTDVPDTDCGDTDTDGYTDEAEAGTPVCADAVNDDNLDDANVNDGCPAIGAAEAACANALDDDGDGRVNDGCVTVGGLSEAAYNIGTSAAGPCSVGAVPNPSPSWPSDFASGGIPNSTDVINIYDIVSFIAPTRRLGTRPDAAPPPGSAFSARWDLVPGRGIFPTWIAVTDITALLAGAPGYPPMFGGVRAFNGPACVGP